MTIIPQTVVFHVMTTCSLVGGYQHFIGTYSCRILLNVSYDRSTMSQPCLIMALFIVCVQYEGVLISLSPTRKETSYSDQTRDLFNTLPTKLNTVLGPLLFCKPLKKIQKFVRPTKSLRQQRPLRRTKNGDLSIVFSVQGTF